MGKQEKNVLLSGIQPSGELGLGHYIGALRNWVRLQDEYECFYTVVDMHCITVRQEPAKLRQQCLSVAAQYMAVGLDPKKSVLFIQSHVVGHAELQWVLGCFAPFGELSRMTQFKEKSQKYAKNVNAGLFMYPVLMAADILLYNAAAVPVGEDQKQHLEFTRNLAARFNEAYSPTFNLPEPYIPKTGARIMSLSDPTVKMSKSDENPNSYIAIVDEPDVIRRRIRSAVTDGGAEIRAATDKPGITNLLEIFSALGGRDVAEIEAEYAGRGYGEFKNDVAEIVVETFRPIRERYRELIENRDYLLEVLNDGAQRAQRVADRTLAKVYRKIGFPEARRTGRGER